MQRDPSMSIHLAPELNDDAMDEERREATPGRRTTDGELFRAADTAISTGWRWAQILATIIGFGFAAGIFYVKSNATTDAILDLRSDMREFRSELTRLRDERQAEATQSGVERERFAALARTVDEQRSALRDLQGQVNDMRNMREAYVYSQSQRGKMAQPVPP